MATLRYNIGATDEIIKVSSPGDAAKGLRFLIDDELLELTDFDKFPYRGGTRANLFGLDNTRWIVNRGVDGTTPASHSAGASLVAVVSASIASTDLSLPDPVVPAGGGGAVDSVNGQTGVVVLVADDVSADPAGSASAAAATVVDGAPAGLNTLAKIAASIANDEDFEGSMQTALATKQPLDPFLTDLSSYANLAALVEDLKPFFLEPD